MQMSLGLLHRVEDAEARRARRLCEEFPHSCNMSVLLEHVRCFPSLRCASQLAMKASKL